MHHTRVPRPLRYSAIIFDKRRRASTGAPSDLAVDLIDPGYLKFLENLREKTNDEGREGTSSFEESSFFVKLLLDQLSDQAQSLIVMLMKL